MISVLVADDQEMVRTGFRMILAREEDIDVVADARNGQEAVAAARALSPDVILMDIRMPVLDGIEATRRLADCSSKVIILTTFDEDEYVFAALTAGASAFLLKDASAEDLVQAIRVVAEGQALLSPAITRRLIDRFTSRLPGSVEADAVERLTDREREVLRLMADGANNAEIAGRLYVTDATVKTHVARILQKLEVRDRVQAVVVAYRSGLAFDA